MALSAFLSNGLKQLSLQSFSHTKCLSSSASALAVKRTVNEELGLPLPPKIPINGYLRFCKIEIPNLKGLTTKDRSRILSKKWTELAAQEKSQYEQVSEAARQEYQQSKEAYMNSLSEEQHDELKMMTKERLQQKQQKQQQKRQQKLASREKQSKKQDAVKLEKPEKPSNSYITFLKSFQRKDGLSNQDRFLNQVAQAWKDLGEAGQLKYKEKASRETEAYNGKLLEWEHKMLLMGRDDIVRKKTVSEFNAVEKDRTRKSKNISTE